MAAWDFLWWEMPAPRAGSAVLGGSRSITRTFHVQWDAATFPPPSAVHTSAALAQAPSVGAGIFFGVPHPDFPTAFCTEIKLEQHPDDPFIWTETATYSEQRAVPGAALPTSPPPVVPGSPPPPPPANPLPEDRDPFIKSVGFRRVEEALLEDLDGKAYMNAVGDQFENAPTQPRYVAVVESTRWWAAWNINIARGYLNYVNNDTWQGIPAGFARIDDMSGTPKTIDGWVGWEVRTRVEIEDPDHPWNPVKVQDMGWNCNDPDTGEKVAAKDVFGENLAAPVKLNSTTGEPLLPTDPVQTQDFRVFPDTSFSGI